MSVGINTSYNNYYCSSWERTQQQTAKAGENEEFQSAKNGKTQMSAEDYIKKFREQYPRLKFSVGYDTKGSGDTGLDNVVLHPKLLEKMAADPKFAAKVENNIKHIPQGEAWLKGMLAANGKKLVASGCFVDENGNVGTWSVSTTTVGNPKEDERKELLEKLQEKSLTERANIERLMANRAEQKTSRPLLSSDSIQNLRMPSLDGVNARNISRYIWEIQELLKENGLTLDGKCSITIGDDGRLSVKGTSQDIVKLESILNSNKDLSEKLRDEMAIQSHIEHIKKSMVFNKAYAKNMEAAVVQHSYLFNNLYRNEVILEIGQDSFNI